MGKEGIPLLALELTLQSNSLAKTPLLTNAKRGGVFVAWELGSRCRRGYLFFQTESTGRPTSTM